MPARKYNPPEAALAVWEAYVKKNNGKFKPAWTQAPDPKPAYPTFVKLMRHRMGIPEPGTNGHAKDVSEQKAPVLLPAHQEKIRLTDRALTLIGGATDMEPSEFKGYVLGVLALLGKAPG